MRGRVSPGVVIAAVLVLLLVMIGVYGYVLSHDGDTDKLTGFLMATTVPTVTSLLLLLKTDALDEKVSQVQQQTNGNMSKLVDYAVSSAPVVEPPPGTVPAVKDVNGAN